MTDNNWEFMAMSIILHSNSRRFIRFRSFSHAVNYFPQSAENKTSLERHTEHVTPSEGMAVNASN